MYRCLAALVAVYPFGNGAVAAPWPTALVLVLLAGAVIVWRLGGVRLAESDGETLLVRNVFTTRRFAPDRIDRLDVARSLIDLRGDARVVVVHSGPTSRRIARRRVRCSASLTFSIKIAATTTAALAAWTEARAVRCDVEPYRLLSGPARHGGPPLHRRPCGTPS